MATRDKAGMAMKAMVLTLAVAWGSAAGAQGATEQRDLDQKLTAARSVMREVQTRMAGEQGLMEAEQAKMVAAQQSLVEARLATLGPKLAIEQSLIAARQSLMAARLATLEPKLAIEQGLTMARMEPLELKALGMEMQTGGGATRVGQAKDELFAGTEKFAKGASDVTEVNLDPSTMGLVGNERGRNGDLAKRMRFMVVHTYEYPKEGMYNPEDVEVYRKKLEDGTWNCSIHVKDKDGTTDICSRATPDHEGSEMVIIAAEKKELTFIHMSGKMSLDELERMNGGPGRKVLPATPATPNTPPTKGQKNAEPVAPAAPAPPVAPGH